MEVVFVHNKASASIRNNYNDISKLCRESGEPVYLTKNGEGDLVVMDIAAFERRAKDLKLAEDLFNIRTARLSGAKSHSIDDVRRVLSTTIENAASSE